MNEFLYTKQYVDLIEETVLNEVLWNFGDIEEVVTSNVDDSFNNLYWTFFPIFSETNLSKELEYTSIQIYLVNTSKCKTKITIPLVKGSKIIYFVNNSNSQLVANNISIDISNKRGKSIFMENLDQLEITRSNNSQTCFVILNLQENVNSKIRYH